MLAQHPYMGRKASGEPVVSLSCAALSILIYYTVSGNEVRIIRVQHSARYRAAFHESGREFRF